MEIALWIREGVWEATVDAGLRFAGDGGNDRATFVLLHGVEGDAEEAMNAGLSGLLGRGRSRHVDAGWQADADTAAEELLAAAEQRLGRPAQRRRLTGRIEREVVVATEGADLLILSRDGDRRRLGPHSLGPHTRFVVDHAACPVLLVWPAESPSAASMPPPPPPGAAPPPEPPPPPGAPYAHPPAGPRR